MDQDRIGILLAKYMAGELSQEEAEELEWGLLANPQLRDVFDFLRDKRGQPPAGLSESDEQAMLEKGLQQFKALSGLRYKGMLSSVPLTFEPRRTEGPSPGTLQEKKPARPVPVGRWVAAASLLIAVTTLLLLHKQKTSQPLAAHAPVKPKEIATKYGTRSYQELPDGSKLWLNAGSKVVYADSFPDGKRELTLSGEGFFDIKHDPVHPFIIHTGRLDIRVLGTTLNVKAYKGDSAIETTLIKGKVEIDFPDHTERHMVLHPGEKVSVPIGKLADGNLAGRDNGAATISHKAIQQDSIYRTIIETSWVEDKLIFKNERLADVAVRLERWYNIRILFDDDKYQQQKLTGFFKEQSVENVVKALQLITGFHYRMEGEAIHIW